MSIRTNSIERFISEGVKDSIHRAAENAGNAAAMINNLHLAGNAIAGRVEVWQAEQEVWQQRQNALISGVPLGSRPLAAYAKETSKASYEASALTSIYQQDQTF